MEIKPDHVHLFISVQPYRSPHIVLRRIKGRTSRVLRSEFPELLKLPSLWTRSYFVSTTEHVSSETIQGYIEERGEKEVRRTNTFIVEDNLALWELADNCARLWNELNFERRQAYIHYKKFSWYPRYLYRRYAPLVGSATAQQIIKPLTETPCFNEGRK